MEIYQTSPNLRACIIILLLAVAILLWYHILVVHDTLRFLLTLCMKLQSSRMIPKARRTVLLLQMGLALLFLAKCV